MALGGETIGRAYIRILADAKNFDRDLRRQMREHESTYSKLGKEGSAEFNRGWNEESARQKGGLDALRDALQLGEGRMHATGELLGSNVMDGLRDELERRHGDVGSVIAKNLADDFNSGAINFDGIMKRLANIRVEVARATGQITQQQGKQWDELGAAVKRYHDGLDRGGPSRGRLLSDIREMVKRLPKATTSMTSFRNEVTEMRRALVDTAPRMARFRADLEKTGAVVGRVFGKGSRNDFINFFGSFMAGMTRATRALTTFYRWPGLVAEQLRLMINKFQVLMDESGGFGGALLNLAKQGLPGLAAAIGAVVAVVTTLAAVIGPAGAALVGLTGIVLALAGSLGFALVGGAVAAAGALFPLAAAIGVAALAIGGLDKKNKEVKKNLKSFTDEWKELQGHAARGLFGKDGGGLLNLKAGIEAVEPIVKSVSKALGGLLDSFGKTAKTKGFNKLMEDLGAILGPMVTTLGKIAGNLGLGLVRAFIMLEPYITDFLGWMKDVSKAFADAGKPGKTKGLTGMAAFFDAAAGSAMRLWDLIVSVGEVIGTLFGAGKSTGDNLITDLADQAKELNKWLTSPEGQRALQDMFAFAEQLAEALGHVVVAAVNLVDALDTPASRFFLVGMIESLATGVDWLTKGAGLLERWLGFLIEVGTAGIAAFQNMNVGAAGGGLIEWFMSLPGIVGGALMSLNETVSSAVDGFGQSITEWFFALPNMIGGALATMQGTIVVAFGEMGGAIGATLGDIGATVGPFFSGIGSAVSTFNSTVSESVNGMGQAIADWFASLPNVIAGHLATMRGTVAVAFAEIGGAVGDTLGDIGSTVGDFFGGIATQVAESVGRGLDTLQQRLGELPGEIVKAFTSLPENIWAIARQFVEPFKWVYNFLVGHSLIPDLVMAIVGWFAQLPGLIAGVLGDLGLVFVAWVAPVPFAIAGVISEILVPFSGLADKIITGAGDIAGKFAKWVSTLAGKATTNAADIVKAYSGLAGRIITAAGSFTKAIANWLAGTPGRANATSNDIAAAFSGMAADAIRKAGSLSNAVSDWGNKAVREAHSVANGIVNQFRGLANDIESAIGTVHVKVVVDMPTIKRPHVTAIVDVPVKARGGVVNGAQMAMIGEAGPEAIVPLNRPLSQVDPAVRALSAFAQGMDLKPTKKESKVGTENNVNITVITPVEDPRAVASEVFNRLVAASYI